jgi:hypothetical protein
MHQSSGAEDSNQRMVLKPPLDQDDNKLVHIEATPVLQGLEDELEIMIA